MLDRVRLKLTGLSEIVGVDDVSLLALVNEEEQRQLIVTCDTAMRKQIMMFMKDKPESATLYPKVLADILQAQGCQQLIVMITGVKDGEYVTEIIDELSGRHFPIRCSDGILFGYVGRVPIYTTRSLMLAQSVPYRLGETRVGLPLTILSEGMLKMSLEKAIEMENYEMASNLRDELKRRHAKNEGA